MNVLKIKNVDKIKNVKKRKKRDKNKKRKKRFLHLWCNALLQYSRITIDCQYDVLVVLLVISGLIRAIL